MLQHLVRGTIVAYLIGAAGPVFGGEGPSGLPGIEPKAYETLRNMCKCLAAAEQFTLVAQDMTDQVLESGQKIQFSSTRKIAVRRPDRIAAEVTGDLVNERLAYRGDTLTIVDVEQGAYAQVSVPDNIDEMFDYVAANYGIVAPLADLAFSDPCAAVSTEVQIGRYVGLHNVLGVKCHHLAFRQRGLDWQIWIEDGDKPVPRKMIITYKSSPGQPQYIALLGEWNLNPRLPDSMFELQIPEGREKIEVKRVVPPTSQSEQRAPVDQRTE
jgi:hypothetical protein